MRDHNLDTNTLTDSIREISDEDREQARCNLIGAAARCGQQEHLPLFLEALGMAELHSAGDV